MIWEFKAPNQGPTLTQAHDIPHPTHALSKARQLIPHSPANTPLGSLSRVSLSNWEISSGFSLQYPAQNDLWVRDWEGDKSQCMHLGL